MMNDDMNIGEFKKWLASLPPEFDKCDISSVVGAWELTFLMNGTRRWTSFQGSNE